MSRLVALAVLVCLVAAGTASAEHQDPQKRLTKADNARARAMLLTRADLPGFSVSRGGPDEVHVDCADSVSEADLVLTGDAEGKQFESGPVFVGSAAHVYASERDSATSWRRSTTAAALTCAKAYYRRNFEAQGARLRSIRKIAFPRVADRTAAYRITISTDTPQGPLDGYADLVALKHGRAQATLFVGAILVVPPKDAEVRLARLVAGRMKTAMRGA